MSDAERTALLERCASIAVSQGWPSDSMVQEYVAVAIVLDKEPGEAPTEEEVTANIERVRALKVREHYY